MSEAYTTPDYGLATISITGHVKRLIRLGVQGQYIQFTQDAENTLRNVDPALDYKFLVGLGRESMSDPTGKNTDDMWFLWLRLYSFPSSKVFYPLDVESTREAVLITEYKTDDFRVDDLGDDLANMPWYEVPPLIALDVKEALRFLDGGEVGVSCSLTELELFKN